MLRWIPFPYRRIRTFVHLRSAPFGLGCCGIKFRLMSDPIKRGAGESGMFAVRQAHEGGGMPLTAWVVAGWLVLAVVAALVFAGRRKAASPVNTIQRPAAYAANLPLSQLAMSESTSLSGGKSTFVDGHIQNTASQSGTGVTGQVIFHNREGMPPQVETLQ